MAPIKQSDLREALEQYAPRFKVKVLDADAALFWDACHGIDADAALAALRMEAGKARYWSSITPASVARVAREMVRESGAGRKRVAHVPCADCRNLGLLFFSAIPRWREERFGRGRPFAEDTIEPRSTGWPPSTQHYDFWTPCGCDNTPKWMTDKHLFDAELRRLVLDAYRRRADHRFPCPWKNVAQPPSAVIRR